MTKVVRMIFDPVVPFMSITIVEGAIKMSNKLVFFSIFALDISKMSSLKLLIGSLALQL